MSGLKTSIVIVHGVGIEVEARNIAKHATLCRMAHSKARLAPKEQC